MSYVESAYRPVHRRGIAVCVAFLIAVASVVGLPLAAQAATPGITSAILLNGQTYDGTAVVDEGATLTLRVQYDTNVVPGSTVEFELGPNVTVTGVPAGNSAIESVTQNGNKVSVTFKDPWPAGVNQGVFDLNFKVNNVDESKKDTLAWSVNGEQQSVNVIVKNSGDEFANVTEAYAKSVAPGNLDRFVSVVGGQVQLDSAIADEELTYTLRLNSPQARNGYSIADQLPTGLSYVAGSFAAQLTTWDADGLNRTTDPSTFAPTVTGNSFSGTVNVPGPSILTITYKAKVADVTALRNQLQTQYENLNGGTGNFEINPQNTATFGATTRSASFRLRGTVAGVNVGQAFGKTADWSTKNVKANEDGTLAPPTDITYTLKADLRQWVGGPNFTLDRNVVISDVLPSQASWNTGAANFVTSSGLTLTAAATCPDAATFAADSFVGQYCVDGQRLVVNVGKDNTTNASIQAKAVLNTVTGLTKDGTSTIEGATSYLWPNTANYYYRSGNPYAANRNVHVVVLPDDSDGVNDSSVFTKTGSVRDAMIDPGDSVTVDYTFNVTAGKGIDMRDSRIVDYVDTDIFTVGDPSTIKATGSYDGQPLGESDFLLTVDPDGNLVIALAPSGKTLVTTRGADKAFEVKLSLTSKPFEGKQTKTITNKATLFGANGKPLYWSKTSGEATSYGDEAEVRKRLYDPASGDWSDSVGAEMDGAGHLVKDTFVYRIQFIPHGSYDNVVVVPVLDVLPSGVQFLGFVDEADAATGANVKPGPIDVGGNLVATYDAASGKVTLEQKSGTKLDAGQSIAAYFAVKVTDTSGPIVNKIGDTSATIVPLKSVSVGDYVWVDSNRDGRQGTGEPGIPGVVLRIVGPDGLPVTDIHGKPVGPVTTGPDGKYTFENLPALTGNQTYTVRIDRDASAKALAPYVPTKPGVGERAGDSSTWVASTVPGDLHEDGDRDPTLDFGFVKKTYAIGDVVWIDANRDGVQNPGEKPLEGVKVELFKDGKSVATTTTDGNGRYVFDNLPAGTYQVRFTLTDEQKKKYEFTKRDSGSDDAGDSDANPGSGWTRTIVLDDSNTALTGDYEYRQIGATQGIDPTWDAGVVLKDTGSVPPGDDDNGNGSLPVTGLTLGLGAVVAGFALVLIGLTLMRVGRRRTA